MYLNFSFNNVFFFLTFPLIKHQITYVHIAYLLFQILYWSCKYVFWIKIIIIISYMKFVQ